MDEAKGRVDPLGRYRRERPKPAAGRPPKYAKRDLETQNALLHITPVELRFVTGVCQGLSPTRALIQAGYRKDENRAAVKSTRMMQKPLIIAAIHEMRMIAIEEAGISIAELYRETARIALMPLALVDGKVTVGNKMAALKLASEQAGIIKKAPGALDSQGVNSILELIARAGKTVAVLEQTPERVGTGSPESDRPLESGAG